MVEDTKTSRLQKCRNECETYGQHDLERRRESEREDGKCMKERMREENKENERRKRPEKREKSELPLRESGHILYYKI